MKILKKDGTMEEIDLSKIPKNLEWANVSNGKAPNILDKIDDEDISEKVLVEYIQK